MNDLEDFIEYNKLLFSEGGDFSPPLIAPLKFCPEGRKIAPLEIAPLGEAIMGGDSI